MDERRGGGGLAMVVIIDGCSFHHAHIWSKSGFFLICSRHLVTSKESLNSIFFYRKKTLFTSYVRNVK